MKCKRILIFTLVISSIFILGSCSNSKINETSLKEANNVKNEATTENNESSKESISNADKETEDNSFYYESKLGFSINFPFDWKDRYRIKEDNKAMYVCFKSKDSSTPENTGLLFLIMKKYEPEDEDIFESIDNIKYVILGNTKYLVGGPTDLGLDPNNSEYNIFVSMNKERQNILKTMKSSN